MTVATSRPLTTALLAALRAAHSRVGDAAAPSDLTLPYAVLYPFGVGPLSGPVSDSHADADSTVQLTCIGSTREQAEWLADKLRPTALGPLTVTGRKVMQSLLETSQPVRRDDDVQPPLFVAVDQYRFLTTPS